MSVLEVTVTASSQGVEIGFDRKRAVEVISDRAVSVTMAAATAVWVVSAGLMVAGLWDLRFMGWGLWLSAVGATITIRKMLCQSDAKARNAFELGRDYEREPSVRSLR